MRVNCITNWDETPSFGLVVLKVVRVHLSTTSSALISNFAHAHIFIPFNEVLRCYFGEEPFKIVILIAMLKDIWYIAIFIPFETLFSVT